MSIRELDILLALCSAATKLEGLGHAERALRQLGPYLSEAHIQLFISSPLLQDIEPSPWAALTKDLTRALLSIGARFPSLRIEVQGYIVAYVSNWAQISSTSAATITAEDDVQNSELEAVELAAIAVSLNGFLEAAAEQDGFWTTDEKVELIRSVHGALTETILVALEKTVSIIRHTDWLDPVVRDWKQYLKNYAARGRPLGAMLMQESFTELILACTRRLVCVTQPDRCEELLVSTPAIQTHDNMHAEPASEDTLEYLVELVAEQMALLEDGSDYLQLISSWQQRLALTVKARALEVFTHCMVLDEEIADAEVLLAWLEDAIENPTQMNDRQLGETVLRSLAIITRFMPEATSNIARILLRFVVQGTAQPEAVVVAGQSLARILSRLSSDAVITTLYSLGNILSSQTSAEKTHHTLTAPPESNLHHDSISSTLKGRTGSVISLSMSGDEETSIVCANVARAIATIATACNDQKIIALAQTLLLQKIARINSVVDAHIIEQAAILTVHGQEAELRALLRLYSRIRQESMRQRNGVVTSAVQQARIYLAQRIDPMSPLFRIFALHLLERILSKGDVGEAEARHIEVDSIAAEIGPLLKPLAILASRRQVHLGDSSDESVEIETMAREAWYNIAIHGITIDSRLGVEHRQELQLLAMHSAPIFDTERAELLESDVELNIVLRRGMSSHRLTEQRKNLCSALPECESYLRHLDYQKIAFLNAVYLVESLRTSSGSCSEVCTYFADPTLQASDMGGALAMIARRVVSQYAASAYRAQDDGFAAPYVAKQLVKIFEACCHRSAKMQEIARLAADEIIEYAPSALIQKSSIFALLELLTIMWSSCLESEVSEYEWNSTYSSQRGKVTVHLSDDYALRQKTLDAFYSRARGWMRKVIAAAPLDVKGLLQTYLSEFDDVGSYGHVSLGRSFALEMGALIPDTDPRLSALATQGRATNVNVASDFIAQYTTRQEYRFGGHATQRGQRNDHSNFTMPSGHQATNGFKPATVIVDEAQATLHEIESAVLPQNKVGIHDLKGVLRKAAALLCRSKSSQTAIVSHLVNIPFRVFTKDSIKIGISLWLGVIHENSRMEPRILTEAAAACEQTVNERRGIFSPSFVNPDPFYVKEEFAPSDRELLLRQAQHAQNIISPHLRLLQFFQSHFNAIRLGSVDTQRTFIRMTMRILRGFEQTQCHPLMREIHFHAVLFSLRVLRHSTCLTRHNRWRLLDRTISAALHWFSKPPMWSFGGNRLQVKAEVRLIKDILDSLGSLRTEAVPPGQREIDQRVPLLELLLQSEGRRLGVWLSPLGGGSTSSTSNLSVATHIRTAWSEDTSLAIQLLTRYPSDQVERELRFLLCNSPARALREPNALDVLLGTSLPSDLSFQLRYLLVWAPVNPVQAVTYFTPAYKNHPFVLQYAVRALDSHPIDVTFFYVPQIVQALRYDRLGYVERFIIEAGKFSQLFAHQIIWNMKANAYKDDNAEVADELKPTLDQVTARLISSFTGEDKDFFEREFSFFDEVTGVSGKLKPFIKRSKPEKKAKIEEELRKIQVEVGVYLPSNPDGVVVGIDRKSGKPLQSHAKAPYMATFRIRKTRNKTTEEEIRDAEQMLERPSHIRTKSTATAVSIVSDDDPNTYDVWQSAIFKVGDDCRQDVLALQLIAAFRGIFNSVGLDVYVFPYRVTATAPGCGVIDVLPNSISRDMLGREAVNGLHDYFLTKYGGEHSVRYQEARSEFVKSMAAYSVISYLLQFKDRHNGNIMIDDKGHILHIDFGFLFDIAPGGVKFERSPFKLTPEMLAVMGGADPDTSQAYRWFEELTVKAFLCSRQYCGKLLHLVSLMLDSGLPCFKPNTIYNLRSRFMLELSEGDAAKFMLGCIKKSGGSISTKVYDEFQLLTNGIPY